MKVFASEFEAKSIPEADRFGFIFESCLVLPSDSVSSLLINEGYAIVLFNLLVGYSSV